MSDDSFIREVNEEFRQDQAKALWNRFAPIIIAAAVIIVLGVAGWRGYEYWTESRANASGDRFSQALALGEQGKPDEALAAWKEGKATDALALFDQLAADSAAPRNSRERATMMAELIRGSGAAS